MMPVVGAEVEPEVEALAFLGQCHKGNLKLDNLSSLLGTFSRRVIQQGLQLTILAGHRNLTEALLHSFRFTDEELKVAIFESIKAGQLEIFYLLRKSPCYKVAPFYREAACVAITNNKLKLLKSILSDIHVPMQERGHALAFAASRGNVEAVQLLRAFVAKPNLSFENYAPLREACKARHPELIRILGQGAPFKIIEEAYIASIKVGAVEAIEPLRALSYDTLDFVGEDYALLQAAADAGLHNVVLSLFKSMDFPFEMPREARDLPVSVAKKIRQIIEQEKAVLKKSDRDTMDGLLDASSSPISRSAILSKHRYQQNFYIKLLNKAIDRNDFLLLEELINCKYTVRALNSSASMAANIIGRDHFDFFLHLIKNVSDLDFSSASEAIFENMMASKNVEYIKVIAAHPSCPQSLGMQFCIRFVQRGAENMAAALIESPHFDPLEDESLIQLLLQKGWVPLFESLFKNPRFLLRNNENSLFKALQIKGPLGLLNRFLKELGYSALETNPSSETLMNLLKKPPENRFQNLQAEARWIQHQSEMYPGLVKKCYALKPNQITETSMDALLMKRCTHWYRTEVEVAFERIIPLKGNAQKAVVDAAFARIVDAESEIQKCITSLEDRISRVALDSMRKRAPANIQDHLLFSKITTPEKERFLRCFQECFDADKAKKELLKAGVNGVEKDIRTYLLGEIESSFEGAQKELNEYMLLLSERVDAAILKGFSERSNLKKCNVRVLSEDERFNAMKKEEKKNFLRLAQAAQKAQKAKGFLSEHKEGLILGEERALGIAASALAGNDNVAEIAFRCYNREVKCEISGNIIAGVRHLFVPPSDSNSSDSLYTEGTDLPRRMSEATDQIRQMSAAVFLATEENPDARKDWLFMMAECGRGGNDNKKGKDRPVCSTGTVSRLIAGGLNKTSYKLPDDRLEVINRTCVAAIRKLFAAKIQDGTEEDAKKLLESLLMLTHKTFDGIVSKGCAVNLEGGESPYTEEMMAIRRGFIEGLPDNPALIDDVNEEMKKTGHPPLFEKERVLLDIWRLDPARDQTAGLLSEYTEKFSAKMDVVEKDFSNPFVSQTYKVHLAHYPSALADRKTRAKKAAHASKYMAEMFAFLIPLLAPGLEHDWIDAGEAQQGLMEFKKLISRTVKSAAFHQVLPSPLSMSFLYELMQHPIFEKEFKDIGFPGGPYWPNIAEALEAISPPPPLLPLHTMRRGGAPAAKRRRTASQELPDSPIEPSVETHRPIRGSRASPQ